MVDSQDEDAQVAWRALQTAARADGQLRGLLEQVALSPEQGERRLRRWLAEVLERRDAPAELATYVSGGDVERLVNIARAQTVNVINIGALRAPTSSSEMFSDGAAEVPSVCSGPVVFVCSSTEDEEWRRRFVDMLRPLVADRGLGVWSTERGLPAPSGDEHAGVIARSQAALVLVSERLVACDRSRCELEGLRGRNIPLLAVLVEDCAWEKVNALRGVRWWREPPFAAIRGTDGDREMQEIVHACMRLRDRLPIAAVGRGTADRDRSATVVKPLSRPLVAGERAGELHDVPALPWGFVAREELDALRAAVLDARAGVVGITGRALGLHGQGGIGKTVLATELARDPVMRRHFPDGVYWVTVGQHGDLVARQRRLLKRLGVAHGELRSAAQAAAVLADALSSLRCLVVVDDVWSMAAATAFRAVGPRGRVLYTTRDPAVLARVGADVQRVDMLPEQAARELLAAVGGMRLDAWPGEIDRILVATSRVALALALAGATVRRGGRTWRDVADELERAGQTFLDHPYADTFKAMQVGIAALDERLATAYGSLAVYPEDTRVPVAAVMRLWASVHGLSESATRSQLRLLTERALLSFDGHAIDFHDLQREFLLLQTSDVSLLHDDLLRAYRGLLPSPDRPWRQLPRDEPYIWSHLLYHLQGAGDIHGVRTVVCDLGFLAVRCFGDGWAAESDLRTAQMTHPDDRAIAWLLDRLSSWEWRFEGHGTVEEVAATMAAQTDGAPAGIDVRTLLGELLPNVILLARQDYVPPDTLARVLLNQQRVARAVVYAPSGHQLASGHDDGTIRLWDPTSGEQTGALEGHIGGVRYLAYAPSSDQLASAGRDGTVRLWDLATGEQTTILKGHTGQVREVDYAPSGRWLASSGNDGTVRLWDVTNGEQTATLEGHTGRVWAVAYAPSGNQLASAGFDGTVRLWDPATGKQTATLKGHTGETATVNYAPSGTQLASGGADGTVRLWNPVTGEQTATLQAKTRVTSIAWAPSSEQIATTSRDGMVRLWDTATGEQTATLDGHTGGALGIAYAPSGHQLASTGVDGMLRLWDTETGQQTATLDGRARWMPIAACTPSRDQLASAASDGTIRLWDPATGEQTVTLDGHTGWVRALAYAPTGDQLASAGSDGTIRLWDTATGEQTVTLDGHSGAVLAVAYTPSGDQLASAGSDGTVRLWDRSQQRHPRHLVNVFRRRHAPATLTGHTREVTTVAFSPSGDLILSGDSGGTVRLWDSRGTIICCAKVGGNVGSIIWDSEGITIGVDGNFQQLTIVNRTHIR